MLGKNLAENLEQAQAASQDASEPTETIPIESILGGSTALISSRSTPSATLIPLARVKKLEAQMATRLHYRQPWMKRSIAKAEERMERKMAQHTDRKIK